MFGGIFEESQQPTIQTKIVQHFGFSPNNTVVFQRVGRNDWKIGGIFVFNGSELLATVL
jgi:hypothetical protein